MQAVILRVCVLRLQDLAGLAEHRLAPVRLSVRCPGSAAQTASAATSSCGDGAGRTAANDGPDAMAGEGTGWTRSQHLGGRQQCSCACVPRAVRIMREGGSEPGGTPPIGTRTTHNPGTAAPAKDQTHDIRRRLHGSNGKTLESAGTGDRTRSVHQQSLGTSGGG